ncbi:MAG: MATE family efflux transporter [Blautia sp.]|nr:MATE family efflux transporter [Blautia sp.]
MKNFYRNFLKLCSMLVLQNVVTLSVNLADNIMLGAFSETALSGVTTVNQVQFVFQQLLMALGDGLVIFGSQYWGKKETEPVRKIGAWAMRTGFFIALVLFIRIPVLSVYQLSPETREMANTFLIILSVVMVGMSYQMPTNGGIIRGSGSIAYSMKVDLISTWGIVIPLSMFMAFVVKASPAVVVCCLNADQIFKCVPAFLKCNYGHWIINMTN